MCLLCDSPFAMIHFANQCQIPEAPWMTVIEHSPYHLQGTKANKHSPALSGQNLCTSVGNTTILFVDCFYSVI